jgi:hypothetical protein
MYGSANIKKQFDIRITSTVDISSKSTWKKQNTSQNVYIYELGYVQSNFLVEFIHAK